MPLSDIVNVQITRQTTSVSEQGFGTLMILGTFKNWNDWIRKYSSMQEVASDFNNFDEVYVAAQDFFAQAVTPPYMYIGRRTVDTVGILVETAMSGQIYTVTINGNEISTSTTTTVNDSTVTLDADLVTDNLINVSLNGTILGTVTSVLDFDIDFVALNSILATVNGTPLTPVVFNTDQATTMSDLATELLNGSNVLSATVTDTRQITVVFSTTGNNTVDSVITTLGATQPVCTISEGGFVFDTDNLTTMTNIATAIQTALNVGYSPGIATATVSGTTNNEIVITSNPNQAGVLTFFTVTLGASQANSTIVNTLQPTDANTIADAIKTAINNFIPDVGVTASTPNTPNGTLTLTADVPGTPYTLSVSTDLTKTNKARINITQVIPNQAYTVEIDGTNFTYQADVSVASNEEIAADLVALINDVDSLVPVTATDNLDGTFEIESDVSTYEFILQVSPVDAMVIQKGLIIQPYTPSTSVVTDLETIQAVNDDWYALACTDRTVATVAAIAAWIETQTKIFGTASSDSNIIDFPPGSGTGYDSTSIAYQFFNLGYTRSFVMYHQDSDSDYPECAWFSDVLPLVPGSETWAFKQLANISYTDLSSTEQNNAFLKNSNTYQYIGGVGITQRGTVGVGEYIDIIRGVDWLTSTIQTYVYSILINNPKIPYTDSGITAVESQIRRALQQGIDNNFIASDPPYQIFVPTAASVPAIDKANRILKNVKFNATLAGAIQAISITGTVSV